MEYDIPLYPMELSSADKKSFSVIVYSAYVVKEE